MLLGVCVGFLPHNFHPARIFMGDTGSMLLGLLLAYAPISSLATLDPNTLAGPAAYRGGTVNRFPEVLPLLVPAIIMLIPYADLLLAVVRRTRAGMSPFAADKKHLQHRLLDIGHSHRASVLIMYMWAALFAGTVVLLSIMRTKLYVLGIVTAGGILVLLLLSMPRLRWWVSRRPAAPRHPGPRRPAPPRPAASPALAGAVAGAGRPAGASRYRRSTRATSAPRRGRRMCRPRGALARARAAGIRPPGGRRGHPAGGPRRERVPARRARRDRVPAWARRPGPRPGPPGTGTARSWLPGRAGGRAGRVPPRGGGRPPGRSGPRGRRGRRSRAAMSPAMTRPRGSSGGPAPADRLGSSSPLANSGGLRDDLGVNDCFGNLHHTGGPGKARL